MAYNGTRVLITGALPFIGSNLAQRLVSEGAEVTLIDNLEPAFGGNRFNIAGIEERVSVHVADVRDAQALEPLIAGRQFLFNLAAQTSHLGSMQQPFLDLDINANAQLSIVELCRKVNPTIKIVYASTRQLYGKPRYLPVDESHPIRPVDVNGCFQARRRAVSPPVQRRLRPSLLRSEADQRVRSAYANQGRETDIRGLLGSVPDRAREESLVYGDGRQLRDLLYVDDCVDSLLAAGLSSDVDGRMFNIGGEGAIALIDLAKMMTELGLGGSVDLVPFPGERKAIDIGDYYSDSALFTRIARWSPRVELRDGLRRTVDFYKANFGRYV